MDGLGRLKSGLRWVGAALTVVGVLGLAFGWASTTTTQAKGAPASAETPRAFLAEFVSALNTGDRSFLLERMHPEVIARYGTAQCQAYTEELLDPDASLRLVSATGPDPYDYASDGLSRTVSDTYTLAVNGTLAGRDGAREYHFALVDGRFRIFADCGDPVAGS